MSEDIQDVQTAQRRLPDRLHTKCSECDTQLTISPSLSMQMGGDSGHVTCPNCKTFLHVQLGECETTTEKWSRLIARNNVSQGLPTGGAR